MPRHAQSLSSHHDCQNGKENVSGWKQTFEILAVVLNVFCWGVALQVPATWKLSR